MLDEAQRQALAREILNEALEQWIEDGVRHGVQNEVTMNPDGQLSIMYEGETEDGYGSILCYYKPLSAIEGIIEECDKWLNDLIIHENGKPQRFSEQQWEDGAREGTLKSLALFASMFLITGAKSYHAEMLKKLYIESLHVAQMALGRHMIELFRNDEGVTRVWIRDTRSPAEKKAASKIANTVIEKFTSLQPNWEELPMHKSFLDEVWAKAKEIYRDVRSHKTWRDTIKQEIKAEYELELPDDLVTRLAGNWADLSEKAQEKLSTQRDRISQPSDIAIEHAARLCGADHYQFTISYLYQKIREQKQQQEKQ